MSPVGGKCEAHRKTTMIITTTTTTTTKLMPRLRNSYPHFLVDAIFKVPSLNYLPKEGALFQSASHLACQIFSNLWNRPFLVGEAKCSPKNHMGIIWKICLQPTSSDYCLQPIIIMWSMIAKVRIFRHAIWMGLIVKSIIYVDRI